MLRRLGTALFMLFAATTTAGALGAQSGNCAPQDTTSARLIAKFKSIVAAKTLAAKVERSELGLDNVTPSQILLVTDQSICRKAAIAMDSHHPQNSTRHKLYVLTLGTSYGVLDNTILANQYTVAFVFDRNWKYVSNQTF